MAEDRINENAKKRLDAETKKLKITHYCVSVLNEPFGVFGKIFIPRAIPCQGKPNSSLAKEMVFGALRKYGISNLVFKLVIGHLKTSDWCFEVGNCWFYIDGGRYVTTYIRGTNRLYETLHLMIEDLARLARNERFHTINDVLSGLVQNSYGRDDEFLSRQIKEYGRPDKLHDI